MQKKPLAELICDLEQEMLRLSYSEGSMNFYRRRWQMLLDFAQESLQSKNVQNSSRKLCS